MNFDPKNLSEAQLKFIRDHAVDMWALLYLEPNDSIVNVLESDCSCCYEKRVFLRTVMGITG